MSGLDRVGPRGPGQFVLGVGMACAVTALPILILLMEKLELLRQPLGQRILRYASVGRHRHLGGARADPDGTGSGWANRAPFILAFILLSGVFPPPDASPGRSRPLGREP